MRTNASLRTFEGMHDNDTTITRSTGSAAWARVFAAVYEPFLWVGERRGLRTARAGLLGRARGRTVEIGAGTGLNLPYYPKHLDTLVLTEPDPAMRSRLTKKLRRRGRLADVVDAPAERLPFEDGSVDTVVSTFVLCTVGAPDLVLTEIARVLRPDGQLLFIEHVRSESAALASWQDRLAPSWRRFACGCRCNRATAELIVTRGLELEQVREFSWRGMPPIVRPLITGRARPRVASRDAATVGAHVSAAPVGAEQ
jgi:ubiquinone/menaquinone biosynthesis C-methylase UbiE